MALSFPSSPINGAVSGEYTYDATKTAWRKNAAYPVSVTHSDVAPSNPRVGDQWWKSNEGTLFTYYNDGSSSQWVESTNVVANVEPNPIPAGAMMAWASDIIPANWLLCDGSAVSRSTYASLFAIIGTQYGAGDGTTTFNLPNLKGRTIVGKDSAQTEFDVLGETGGAKTHTLTTAEMPSHTHIQDAHNHTQNAHGHSINDPGHQHYLDQGPYTGGGNYTPPGVDNRYLGNAPTRSATTGISINNATATNNATTATNQSTGGGGAHNNLQPYIVLNYIIKFSAGETPGDSQLAVRVGTLETQNNATPLSQNYIINGGFDIWQRGTSITATNNVYVSDRWYGEGGNVTVSRQTTGVPPASTYCMRTAMTSTTFNNKYQIIESLNASALHGKRVTFQVKLRRNASFTGGLVVRLWKSATVDAGMGATWVEIVGVAVSNASLPTGTGASDWYTATITGLIPNDGTANTVRVEISQTVAETSGAYWEMAEAQLEEGTFATGFRRNSPSIQAELAACQRYYQISGLTSAFASNTTDINGNAQFVVEMRATPTASVEGNGRITVGLINIADYTQSAANIYMFATTRNAFFVFGNFSGLTANRPYAWKSNGNQILLSAEL